MPRITVEEDVPNGEAMIFINASTWQALIDRVTRIETNVQTLLSRVPGPSNGTLNRIDQNVTTIRTDVTAIHTAVTAIQEMETRMAKTLDETLADVVELKTKEEGLIALTTSIKTQLDAILAGALTPEQQAKVDALFQAIEDRKTEVQAAIDANTPPAPPPAP